MTPQCSDEEGFEILDQLEDILDHDPLIDELGFIHPSQLLMLNEEADAASLPHYKQEDVPVSSAVSKVVRAEGQSVFFWNNDHKLGISTSCLLLLYKSAKRKFMDALVTYKMHYGFSLKNDGVLKSSTFSEIEHEVMKHSKALLLLSSDFGSAWNARKLVLSKRQEFSISDELLLSTLILSFAPKSENAWGYRRWVIKRGATRCAAIEELLENESKLVEKIAEKSKMNYRAWNHRCWLVSYMTSQQVMHELNATRPWASLHVADSSCFHYRRKLLLRMLGAACDDKDVVTCHSSKSLGLLWKDELEWNEVLIRRYIGREALWLHRRFLSVSWVKNFGADEHGVSHKQIMENANNSVHVFMDRELGLLQDCLSLPDSEFDDVQSQAVHSAAYILFLHREVFQLSNVNLNCNQKIKAGDLIDTLNRLCPEKTKLWDSLMPNLLLHETGNFCWRFSHVSEVNILADQNL